ncbi:MAG: hypothetical protein AAB538_00670, partial [Patescibacteria group bacterium]
MAAQKMGAAIVPLLEVLAEHKAGITSRDGRATAALTRAMGIPQVTCRQRVQRARSAGWVDTTTRGRKTYKIAITDTGRIALTKHLALTHQATPEPTPPADAPAPEPGETDGILEATAKTISTAVTSAITAAVEATTGDLRSQLEALQSELEQIRAQPAAPVGSQAASSTDELQEQIHGLNLQLEATRRESGRKDMDIRASEERTRELEIDLSHLQAAQLDSVSQNGAGSEQRAMSWRLSE